MIHIPAAIIYLASIALVILLGSGITAVVKLTARVRALEQLESNRAAIRESLRARALKQLE